MQKFLILFAALALSACTKYWTKPDTPVQETLKDLYQCRKEGAEANQGGRVLFTAEQMEGTCMGAKGYTLSLTPPKE